MCSFQPYIFAVARDPATGLIFSALQIRMLNNRMYTSDTPTHSCGNVMAFLVGDMFQSYQRESGNLRPKTTFSYIRVSRTLQGAKKRAPSRVEKANISLKYLTIDLACLFWWKRLQCEGERIKTSQKVYSLQLCMKLTSH